MSAKTFGVRLLNSEKMPKSPGVAFALRDDLLRRAFERQQAAAATVLHHHLESTAGADAADGRWLNREDERVLDRRKLLVQLALDALCGKSLRLALMKILETREDGAGI